MDGICKDNVLLVIGDWNAKFGNMTGEYLVRLYGLGNQKKPGDQLINFCHFNDFFVGNIVFKQ